LAKMVWLPLLFVPSRSYGVCPAARASPSLLDIPIVPVSGGSCQEVVAPKKNICG